MSNKVLKGQEAINYLDEYAKDQKKFEGNHEPSLADSLSIAISVVTMFLFCLLFVMAIFIFVKYLNQ